jgi:3-oxoacyl-[acyl-carrier-protein] synthase III
VSAAQGQEDTVDARVRVAGAARHLPSRQLTSREVEERVVAASDGFVPPRGVVERMTGIRSRHLMPDDWQASDLAAAPVRELVAEHGAPDLLIYASASQDMVEPATAHIVAAKTGLDCPVFDVKNACNSVLNGLEVAEALLLTGAYRRAIVCAGESPSRAIKWRVADFADFRTSFPGYTLSDAGAAVLLERLDGGRPGPRGIFGRAFTAASEHWEVGTLPAGGSAHPRGEEWTYFRGDGTRLKDVFVELGADVVLKALAESGTTWDDYAAVLVHQVAMPFLDTLVEVAGMPADRLVVTLPEHGNMAAATLPVQYTLAVETGRIRPGDKVAWVGLAGGVSLGAVLMEV